MINQLPLGGNVPPAAPPQPAAPAPAAAAAPAAVPGDQLQIGGAESQIAMWYQQLQTGSPAEASLAMYQLENLAATHRAQVLPILLSQLDPYQDPMRVRVALDIVGRLRPPEAVPYVQALSTNSDPGLRQAALSTHQILVPPPPPPPPPQPGAPQISVTGPGGVPSAPQPIPGAPPLPTVTPGPQASGSLYEQLKDGRTAYTAAAQASQLPTEQLMALYNQIIANPRAVRAEAVHLVTVAVARRNPPGMMEAFQRLLKAGPHSVEANAVAAHMLVSTQNPAVLPDALRLLVHGNSGKHGRALIDKIVANPQLLNHPAVAVILASVCGRVTEDLEVRLAASHALGLIRNKQARDGLAASSLLRHDNPVVVGRALADLGQHPAPYPPHTITQLQTLLRFPDANVSAQARALLQKSGVKV